MSANVDLQFCDLCGLSIPQKDLDSGLAKVINDKTVGVCCLSLILDQPSPGVAPVKVPSSGSSSGSSSVSSMGARPAGAAGGATGLFPVALLLVALAGATAFLEWRAGARNSRTRTQIEGLATQIETTQGSLEAMEAKVAAIPAKSMEAKLLALQSEADRIGQAISAIKPADDSALQKRLMQLGLRMEDLANRFAGLDGRQGSLERSMQGGFENLTKELARMGARPAAPAAVKAPAGGVGGTDAGAGSGPALALPADLAKEVTRLSDPEAGERWAAIDALLSKKDPRVVPYLVPTLKDEDPFIRRLTAMGLGKLDDKRAIWPLFDAMSDSESIVRSAAYRSLVKLTKEFGKPLAFDPDASKDKRKNALKKWKAWLEKRLAH